jgi:hypothetical protein
MKASHLFTCWCMGMILAPCLGFSQNDDHTVAYSYNDEGNAVTSNVPLNEINAHAWRNFHRLFPTAAGEEKWVSSVEGYKVSFNVHGQQYQAWFGNHGAYRYSLHYYPGKEIPREPGDLIRRKYPEYQLNIVTEITDGEKTVYLVRLVSPMHIKTLSVCDGDLRVIEEEAISSGQPDIAAVR